MIYGCTKQLLLCHGQKGLGQLIGCAEQAHILCMPCLSRWFGCAQKLRAQNGLNSISRRCCPVCRCELRAAGTELRASGADKFWMGLRKIEESWV